MYLAQFNTGDARAFETLRNSIQLSRATFESWRRIFDDAINPDSGLWIGVTNLGLLILALTMLYATVTTLNKTVQSLSWTELINLFVPPFLIFTILSNNGALLAQMVDFTIGVGEKQVQSVLQIQLAGATLEAAVNSVAVADAAKRNAQSITNECKALPPAKLAPCLERIQPALQRVLADAQRQGASGNAIDQLRSFFSNNSVGSIFGNPFMFFAQEILYDLQWIFINTLEAAVLLTALFSPIALGLSALVTPVRPIVPWLIGLISLFAIKLGYNIIVGVISLVMSLSNTATASDLVFILFASIFAPALAIAIGTGGGMAIFQSLIQGQNQIAGVLSAGLSSIAQVAVYAQMAQNQQAAPPQQSSSQPPNSPPSPPSNRVVM